jgi:hypothetical protein
MNLKAFEIVVAGPKRKLTGVKDPMFRPAKDPIHRIPVTFIEFHAFDVPMRPRPQPSRSVARPSKYFPPEVRRQNKPQPRSPGKITWKRSLSLARHESGTGVTRFRQCWSDGRRICLTVDRTSVVAFGATATRQITRNRKL